MNMLACRRIVGLVLLFGAASPVLGVPPQMPEGISYSYDIVALEGDMGLVEIERFPSINAGGLVAFVGRTEGTDGRLLENIYAWTPDDSSPVLRRLFNDAFMLPMDGDDPTQTFGPQVIINNDNLVLARRYLRGIILYYGTWQTIPLTYLETWDALESQSSYCTQVVGGDAGVPDGGVGVSWINPLWPGPPYYSPSPPDWGSPFSAIYSWASFNNVGQPVLTGLRPDGNYLSTETSPGFFVGAGTGDGVFRPAIADDGNFVFRLGSSDTNSIWLMPYDWDPFPLANIGGSDLGFELRGQHPAISDDGQLVAFCAMDGDDFGIFVSRAAAGWLAERVAGPRLNGFLDPGETFLDLNNNDVFDPGIGELDYGPFAGFELNQPLGVAQLSGQPTKYTLVFVATRWSGERGIYSLDIDVSGPTPQVERYGSVIQFGESLDGVPGTVVDFAIHDPINDLGQVAFFVETSLSSATVRANPARSLEVVDYNHPEFRLPPAVIDDYSRMSVGGLERRGMAADGVTPLLLRTPAYAVPGWIQVKVEDEFGSLDAEDVGVLENAMTGAIGNPILIPLEENPFMSGEYKVFALLTAPANFVRDAYYSEDATLGAQQPRTLKITTTFLPDGPGDSVTNEQLLELHRPPVVLVHGLWSDPTTWRWPLVGDPRFVVTRADYRTTHAAHYRTNIPHVRSEIQRALNRMRGRGIAATQADVFGHSMGGVLSRAYSLGTFGAQQTLFRRPDNYDQGDIHKLVTVDSPMYGSELANILVYPDNTATGLGELFQSRELFGASARVDAGAVLNLRVDSPETAQLHDAPPDLPSHAIFGSGGSDQPTTTYAKATWVPIGLACMNYPFGSDALDLMFGGDAHDVIVSVPSQKSGLSGDYVTPIAGAQGQHGGTTGVTASPLAGAWATTLLNQPIDSDYFRTGFPSGFVPRAAPPPCILADALEALSLVLSVVREDDRGATTILATVTPDPGESPSTIAIMNSLGQVVVLDEAPFEAEFELPADHVGEVEFSALGTDADETLLTSVPEAFFVPPPDGLLELEAAPDPLELWAFAPDRQVEITGHYSDGVARDLTGRDVSVAFAVDDSGIAMVDDAGVVSAVSVGSTMLHVVLADQQVDLRVIVFGVPGDWDSNGAVDIADAQALTECYSGPMGLPEFVAPAAECLDALDFDHDGDLDLQDFCRFQCRFGAGL